MTRTGIDLVLVRELLQGSLSSILTTAAPTSWSFPEALIAGFVDDFAHWDVAALARKSSGGSVRIERHGRTRIVQVPGTAAAALYEGGLPVVLTDLPPLQHLGAAFAEALALPKEHVTCTLFAAHAGGVAPPHFDTAFSISFQMVGRKRWTICPNALAELPISN